MIRLPTSAAEAAALGGSFRAGGTDLQERRRHGIHRGDVTDLRDLTGLDAVDVLSEGEVRIGALVTVAALAASPVIQQGYPGLALAAAGLATPQIRRRATVGGNLTQEVRCWYYRSPQFRCLKEGGEQCLARSGDHLFHSCFDQGPCIAPHPSTLAMALSVYSATVQVEGAPEAWPLSEVIGDGSDPRQTHALPPEALLTHVVLPPPVANERAAYLRAISRSRAEWPVVEAIARLQVDGDTITAAWVAAGGVANTPLRLAAVEAALIGRPAQGATLEAAAALAAEGASPLPMTGYKVPLLRSTVQEALERALGEDA